MRRKLQHPGVSTREHATSDLTARIEEALHGYRESAALVKELIARREHPQEIILLVCARLDSLAHLRFSPETDKVRFVNFLERYSYLGDRIREISVPDLYDEVCRWLWTLPGFVDVPGRLHLFDPLRDAKFLQFVADAGAPITEKGLSRELTFILGSLQKKYRVIPKQSRSKPSQSSLEEIATYFTALERANPPWRNKTISALRGLYREFGIGALIYSNYRCAVIHEHKVGIEDDEFFGSEEIEWRPAFYPWDTISPRLSIRFSAAMLARLLETSLDKLALELKHRSKLPAPLFFETCHPLRDSELLDVDSIGPGRDVRLAR